MQVVGSTDLNSLNLRAFDKIHIIRKSVFLRNTKLVTRGIELFFVNVANGNTKLFGNPYIMIGDEMFTAAESTGMSLADAMVRANTVWEKMSEEDQANLNAFVSEWKALNAWSEDVLELLDNFTIA